MTKRNEHGTISRNKKKDRNPVKYNNFFCKTSQIMHYYFCCRAPLLSLYRFLSTRFTFPGSIMKIWEKRDKSHVTTVILPLPPTNKRPLFSIRRHMTTTWKVILKWAHYYHPSSYNHVRIHNKTGPFFNFSYWKNSNFQNSFANQPCSEK